jgi:hypothetical protein
MQSHIGVSVSFNVALDLFGPVPGICAVLSASMVGTTMPETAVDKDSDLGPRKDDVGLAPQVGQWPAMQEVAKTEPVKFPTKGKLGSGVPSG